MANNAAPEGVSNPTASNTQHVVSLIANPALCLLESDLVGKCIEMLEGSELKWLAESEAAEFCIKPSFTGNAPAMLSEVLNNQSVDFAVQPAQDRKKQVLIADMDSTMIDQECIDELAAEIGVKERVSAITAAAMNGEIEFEPALRERVALLKGLPETIADEVISSRITLARGGKTLVSTMKHHGNYCALVSGGFTLFTSRIARMLGFDENHANILEIADGRLTGKVREPILGAAAKVEALKKIAAERRLSPQNFIAVGDGANDLPMLELAGTGVALHAKPSVAARASIRIDHGDLTALLYLQGYEAGDFVQAIA